MSAHSASISWLMVTRCSWVSSQNASSKVVRSRTWSSRVGEGLVTVGSARGGGGGWMGGGWGGGGGGGHACQTRSDMLSTPSHPKVNDLSHKPHRIEEHPT